MVSQVRVSKGFEKQVLGYGLTTAELVYRRPDRRWLLPEARPGFSREEDSSFNAANAILADSGLKPVFRAAVKQGYAIVGPAG
jgi:hypothetical protein